MRKRIASIDLGSNAIRLLIAEECEGRLESIESDRASVRLGEEAFSHGKLSIETMDKVVQALSGFKVKMEQASVVSYRAIATSAMRDAVNSNILIHRATAEAGIQLEIINGEEEARLVHLAVSKSIVFSKNIDLLVDIGGGSVEITLVKSGKVVFAESFKMGTVRLMQLFGRMHTSEEDFGQAIVRHVQIVGDKIKQQLGAQVVERCIGTGGNLESFLKLRKLFFDKGGAQIELFELQEILTRLQSMSVQQRIEDLGLRVDRADVIVPAAIIMLQMLSAAGANKLIVPGVGVKEGVVYDLFRQEEGLL